MKQEEYMVLDWLMSKMVGTLYETGTTYPL
jgi:hypothetical protein